MDKVELMRQIQEKQQDISKLAEQIGFDPGLLKLYLINDTYPMPKRIIAQLNEAMAA